MWIPFEIFFVLAFEKFEKSFLSKISLFKFPDCLFCIKKEYPNYMQTEKISEIKKILVFTKLLFSRYSHIETVI